MRGQEGEPGLRPTYHEMTMRLTPGGTRKATSFAWSAMVWSPGPDRESANDREAGEVLLARPVASSYAPADEEFNMDKGCRQLSLTNSSNASISRGREYRKP